MNTSVWHRFPKKDYLEIRTALESFLQLDEEQLNKKEKEEVLKLIESAEIGFKNKKNEDLNLDFLIRCIEFFLIENEKTLKETNLKRTLKHLMIRREGG